MFLLLLLFCGIFETFSQRGFPPLGQTCTSRRGRTRGPPGEGALFRPEAATGRLFLVITYVWHLGYCKTAQLGVVDFLAVGKKLFIFGVLRELKKD